MATKAVLKPEERAERSKAETAAFAGLQQRGAELRRETMATQARERKEAGLPPEQPGEKKGLAQ